MLGQLRLKHRVRGDPVHYGVLWERRGSRLFIWRMSRGLSGLLEECI